MHSCNACNTRLGLRNILGEKIDFFPPQAHWLRLLDGSDYCVADVRGKGAEGEVVMSKRDKDKNKKSQLLV